MAVARRKGNIGIRNGVLVSARLDGAGWVDSTKDRAADALALLNFLLFCLSRLDLSFSTYVR